MIGNAVPVNLGYYVADAIFRYSGEKRLDTAHAKSKKPQQLNLFNLSGQYAYKDISDDCMLREN